MKSVLITGCSSGFGRLTALRFAREGWRVFATMRNLAGANAAAADALRAAGAEPLELDVTDDASVDAAARAVASAAGALDVLVNNAGSGFFGPLEAFSLDAVERLFDVNVFGALRVNRAFQPAMRARRAGLVVYVSSVVGRTVAPFGGLYAATKWALEAAAEASSFELAPFDVDVAIVEPGAYQTEIFDKVALADDAERLASYGEVAAWAATAPMRLAKRAEGTDPEDVARAIVALAQAAPGTRPIRTVVAANPGPIEALNAALAPIELQMASAFGQPALVPKALRPPVA